MKGKDGRETEGVSRRGFISGGGAAAIGVALLRPTLVRGEDLTLLPVGTWPWPEAGLDPSATAGADATGLSGCATTTFGLIVNQLKVALPDSPWAYIPPQLASAFNGGGPYGSDCGSLQGGQLVMTLVGAPKTLKQEYYQWYCNFAFPSTEWDDLYDVAETVQSVAGSPLCHESRAIWEGVFLREVYPITGVYDNTRCRKLPRDCTKKTVELINAFKLEDYQGAWEPDSTFESCYDCHTDLYAAKEPGGIHSGNEDCNRCHEVSRRHSGGGNPRGGKGR